MYSVRFVWCEAVIFAKCNRYSKIVVFHRHEMLLLFFKIEIFISIKDVRIFDKYHRSIIEHSHRIVVNGMSLSANSSADRISSVFQLNTKHIYFTNIKVVWCDDDDDGVSDWRGLCKTYSEGYQNKLWSPASFSFVAYITSTCMLATFANIIIQVLM